MMKKLYFIGLIIGGLFCFSCSSDDDGSEADSATTGETSNSQFQGVWEGSFSGDDNGVWNITIDANGILTGMTNSRVFNQALALVGTVDNEGKFSATVGAASSGAIFTGTFMDTTGSGTWVNSSQGLSGVWIGTKK